MKTFLTRVAVFTSVQLLIFVSLLLGFYNRNPNHYLAATIDKHQRLVKTNPPRLIFIGGSCLAFGLVSEMVKDEFPAYEPVNMGLHGALRMDFMLNEVRDYVEKGDVIVINIEYEQLLKGLSTGARGEILVQLLEYRPKSAIFLSAGDIKGILNDGLFAYIGTRVRESVGRLLGDPEIQSDVYSRSAFNIYGDAIKRENDKRIDISQVNVGLGKLSTQYLDNAIELLNDFANYCREKRAVVLFAFPQYPLTQFNEVRERIKYLDDTLSEKLEIKIVNTPEEMVMPAIYFYDTIYHLTGDGAREKTKRLIKQIRGLIKNPSG